jgi:hypothetical protein
MLEEHAIELINAGVDGELSDARQQELKTLLDDSEEARNYYSEVEQLADTLNRLPALELPVEIHGKIVDGIDLPARSSRASIFRFGEMPSFLRYGMATAVVLLLAVGLYGNREELAAPGDVADMVGTITRGGPHTNIKVLDTFSFERKGASAQISLEERNGSYLLDVRMDADRTLEFHADFSGDSLGFEAFAQMQSHLDSMHFADNSIRVTGTGEQRFVVMLRREADATAYSKTGIRLNFSSEGDLIQEGVIEPGW